ncbi:LOW QUALITY PROTEIN: inhibitor of nuclear factor kappa-B kinase subunit epsilon [Alosa sapidissima]|uniref:LOW QUALITY PROTEIN: inhibitor of nuclear factor kappa-B kinase subunit epsilon n=1 Tax=Alosa sapidissima TaxID=34773 RepID=UPI001C0842D7|nr:LOW QUALITY PROTEIN: inhibitor of nuclear factor kappa-B kinase subunit epsilon [Alosa sapidissima]
MTASTAGYLWSLEDILGQGATASVHKARNKKTGELVAVKVFNVVSYSRPYEVQMREFEMLRRLNHVNIVKLFTVEEMHMNPKQKVLVMEYCSGGSLLNQLEEPENAFGLPEAEFLIVLQCVVHGMNHLRQNGVVHRDIKPGNIMRQVGEDGRSIYKLTDFGAARELEDDEKFMSIYGTEEYLLIIYLICTVQAYFVLYLHTDWVLYSAVCSYVVGVCVYCVCVCLSVCARVWRAWVCVRYKITTEKPTGAIAGLQRVLDGPIEWSYQLPHQCQLSEGLKGQMVPVLAGILEANQDKCWGFDQFLAATTDILHRVTVHLFSLQQATAHTIYIHFYNTASIFCEEVQAQTGMEVDLQSFLYQGHRLLLEPGMKVVNLPPTTPQRPLFLFGRRPNNTREPRHREPESQVIPTRFDVMADYSFSKTMVGVIHQYLKLTRSLHMTRELMLQGFYSYIESTRVDCEAAIPKISIITVKLQSCLNLEDKIYSLSQSHSNFTECSDNQRRLRQVQENLPVYANGIREFQNKVEHLQVELAKHSETLAEDKNVQKMEILLGKIVCIHQQFRKDRSMGNLSYNDEQIHKFEKINLSTHIKKVKSLYRDDCMKKLQDVLLSSDSWTSVLFEIQSRLQDFSTFFRQLMEDLQVCYEEQNKCLDEALQRVLQSASGSEGTGKDHMILRMNRLKDEMEVLARELQSNNRIIESLGAVNSGIVLQPDAAQPKAM